MFIVTVIPIARATQTEELSYFSQTSYEEGSVINVPLRKKEVRALVLSSTSVTASKTEVKQLQFTLRKLPTQFPLTTLPQAFIRSAGETAEFHATTRGAVIHALLPSFATEAYPNKEATLKHRSNTTYCLQAYRKDRYEKYKSIVREAFAKDESVFIVCSHRASIELIQEAIKSGIEQHVFTISSSLSKKKQSAVWQSICEHTHPVVVIGTAYYVTVPRYDFSLFVIDEENSDAYVLQRRPFIDMRYFIKRFAFHSLASVLFADSILRTETYFLHKDEKIEQYRPFSWNYRGDSITRVVDVSKATGSKKGSLELFSPYALDLLTNLKARREKSLLYVSRKGTYPLTQCDDCGAIVSCTVCEYPLVLYRHEGKTFYACHICNRSYDTDVRCQKCTGWRLSTLGIGVNLVEDFLKETFPSLPLTTLDGVHINKPKEIKEHIEAFNHIDHGILLTTQKGLPYISQEFDSVIVVSVDPLFAIPDLRMNERIMRLLTELKSHARRHCVIQTRHGNMSLLKKVSSGDTESFFEGELKEREQFNMPPYSRLIKISWTGTPEALKKGKSIVHTLFEAHSPEYYISFFKTQKGHSIFNALIKAPRSEWPDTEMLKKLRSIPPSFLIQIEPTTIL